MIFHINYPVDLEILNSEELRILQQQYLDKFQEPFIDFSYDDFQAQGGKCAAQVYKEALEKALQDNKPSTLKHQLTPFEIMENEFFAREREIDEAMEQGRPIQLTAKEL